MYSKPIPYSTVTGHQVTWVNPYLKDGSIEWRENIPFKATLTFTGFCRGRSSVTAKFIDKSTGKDYSLFFRDFEELFLDGKFTGTEVTGDWAYCKRGANYSLEPVIV